jgi:hypothetical protein
MTQLLALVIALFPPGDSDLLRYRLPDITISAFNLNLNDNSHLGTRHYGKGLGLELSPDYRFMMLGERMNLALNASFDAEGQPFYVSSAAPDDTPWSGSWFRIYPGASAGVDWYPFKPPLGVGADFSADYRLTRLGETRSDSSGTDRRFWREFSYWASLEVGPSLGRFRDARTVIQALRILEILTQERQALRAADGDDVQVLADLLATKPSFSLHFHQPGKSWFADLETMLRNRGLAHPRMPARTWFLIREAIETATSLARPVGWRLSIRPGLQLSKWSYRDSSADRNWDMSYAKRIPRLTLGLETGYPLSRRLQFTQSASWQMTTDTTWSRSDITASIAIDYHVFDQLIATVGYSVSYAEREHQPEQRSVLHHGPALSATYFREDRLKANASLGIDWSRYHQASSTGPLVRETALDWSLGLSYRLMP